MTETISSYSEDLPPGSLITQDGQMQWAGLLLGPGTPFPIDRQGLTGWEDLPDLDSSDADRPTGHGAWPGALWAKPRTVAAQVWVLPDPGNGSTQPTMTALDSLRIMRQALSLRDQERWLTVRLHGETLAVRARVNRRTLPVDRQYATQGATRASVQWLATDPRRYSVNEQSAGTGAPEPESGLTWPLTWPLDWGQPASTGDVRVVNEGSAPTHPVITFRGPCGGPTVTERISGQRLRYLIDLAAGDELVIDTAEGTVTLNGSASRRHTAAPDSNPEELFALEPGAAELSFRPDTAQAGSRMSLRWRGAEW